MGSSGHEEGGGAWRVFWAWLEGATGNMAVALKGLVEQVLSCTPVGALSGRLGLSTRMDTLHTLLIGWLVFVVLIFVIGTFFYYKFIKKLENEKAAKSAKQDAQPEGVAEGSAPQRYSKSGGGATAVGTRELLPQAPPAPPARKPTIVPDGPRELVSPPVATGADPDAVNWANNIFTWLYNSVDGGPIMTKTWLETVSESTVKTALETGILVEVVEVYKVSPAPILSNMVVDCSPNDNMTITCDCDAIIYVRLVTTRTQGEVTTESEYACAVNPIRGRLNIAILSEQLMAVVKFDGWPEVDLEIEGIRNNATGLHEQSIVDVIGEVVTSAVRNAVLDLNFQNVSTFPRFRRARQAPDKIIPVGYDSMVRELQTHPPSALKTAPVPVSLHQQDEEIEEVGESFTALSYAPSLAHQGVLTTSEEQLIVRNLNKYPSLENTENDADDISEWQKPWEENYVPATEFPSEELEYLAEIVENMVEEAPVEDVLEEIATEERTQNFVLIASNRSKLIDEPRGAITIKKIVEEEEPEVIVRKAENEPCLRRVNSTARDSILATPVIEPPKRIEEEEEEVDEPLRLEELELVDKGLTGTSGVGPLPALPSLQKGPFVSEACSVGLKVSVTPPESSELGASVQTASFEQSVACGLSKCDREVPVPYHSLSQSPSHNNNQSTHDDNLSVCHFSDAANSPDDCNVNLITPLSHASSVSLELESPHYSASALPPALERDKRSQGIRSYPSSSLEYSSRSFVGEGGGGVLSYNVTQPDHSPLLDVDLWERNDPILGNDAAELNANINLANLHQVSQCGSTDCSETYDVTLPGHSTLVDADLEERDNPVLGNDAVELSANMNLANVRQARQSGSADCLERKQLDILSLNYCPEDNIKFIDDSESESLFDGECLAYMYSSEDNEEEALLKSDLSEELTLFVKPSEKENKTTHTKLYLNEFTETLFKHLEIEESEFALPEENIEDLSWEVADTYETHDNRLRFRDSEEEGDSDKTLSESDETGSSSETEYENELSDTEINNEPSRGETMHFGPDSVTIGTKHDPDMLMAKESLVLENPCFTATMLEGKSSDDVSKTSSETESRTSSETESEKESSDIEIQKEHSGGDTLSCPLNSYVLGTKYAPDMLLAERESYDVLSNSSGTDNENDSSDTEARHMPYSRIIDSKNKDAMPPPEISLDTMTHCPPCLLSEEKSLDVLRSPETEYDRESSHRETNDLPNRYITATENYPGLLSDRYLDMISESPHESLVEGKSYDDSGSSSEPDYEKETSATDVEKEHLSSEIMNYKHTNIITSTENDPGLLYSETYFDIMSKRPHEPLLEGKPYDVSGSSSEADYEKESLDSSEVLSGESANYKHTSIIHGYENYPVSEDRWSYLTGYNNGAHLMQNPIMSPGSRKESEECALESNSMTLGMQEEEENLAPLSNDMLRSDTSEEEEDSAGESQDDCMAKLSELSDTKAETTDDEDEENIWHGKNIQSPADRVQILDGALEGNAYPEENIEQLMTNVTLSTSSLPIIPVTSVTKKEVVTTSYSNPTKRSSEEKVNFDKIEDLIKEMKEADNDSAVIEDLFLVNEAQLTTQEFSSDLRYGARSSSLINDDTTSEDYGFKSRKSKFLMGMLSTENLTVDPYTFFGCRGSSEHLKEDPNLSYLEDTSSNMNEPIIEGHSIISSILSDGVVSSSTDSEEESETSLDEEQDIVFSDETNQSFDHNWRTTDIRKIPEEIPLPSEDHTESPVPHLDNFHFDQAKQPDNDILVNRESLVLSDDCRMLEEKPALTPEAFHITETEPTLDVDCLSQAKSLLSSEGSSATSAVESKGLPMRLSESDFGRDELSNNVLEFSGDPLLTTEFVNVDALTPLDATRALTHQQASSPSSPYSWNRYNTREESTTSDSSLTSSWPQWSRPQSSYPVYGTYFVVSTLPASTPSMGIPGLNGKRLLVKIVKAVGIGCDKNVAEAYSVVEMDEPPQKFTTAVVKDTSSPFWDEQFLFDLSDGTLELLFEIYDKNDGNFLGLGIVGIEELVATPSQRQIIPLQTRPYEDDEVSGSLTVEFLFLDRADLPDLTLRSSATSQSLSPRGDLVTTTTTTYVKAPESKDVVVNGGDGVAAVVLRDIEEKKTVVANNANKSTMIIHASRKPGEEDGYNELPVEDLTALTTTATTTTTTIPTSTTQSSAAANSLITPSTTTTTATTTTMTNTEPVDPADLDERGRSRGSRRKRDSFFGTLKKRFSRSKVRSKSMDPGARDMSLDRDTSVGRSVSMERTAHMRASGLLSVPASSGGDGGSTRSSISDTSAISSSSTRTYVNEASTLIVETSENGILKHFLIPLALQQKSKWRKKGLKLHVFGEHTFLAKHMTSSTPCQVCQKTLGRRFGKQGYECRDCGFKCHKPCHVKTDTVCPNSTVNNMDLEYVKDPREERRNRLKKLKST